MRTPLPLLLAVGAWLWLATAGATGEPALSLLISCAATPKDGQKPDRAECSAGAGSPLIVEFTVMNTGDASAVLRAGDLSAPPSDFEIRRADGRRVISQIEIRRRGRSGGPVVIEPGKGVTHSVNLIELFPPEAAIGRELPSLYEPGAYTVVMTLTARPLPAAPGGEQLWSGLLVSPALPVRVFPLSDEERQELWARLRRGETANRKRLACVLTMSLQEQWDPSVLSLLDDPDAEIRVLAVLAVTNAKRTDTRDKLQEMLTADPSALVRSCAAIALGKMRLRESVPVLIEVVAARQELSYRAAIRALAMLGDRAAIPVLKNVAETDDEQWVRELALESIRKIEQSQD